MSKEEDKKFFTLFTLVVIAISILMVIFFVLGGKYAGDRTVAPLNIQENNAEEAVAEAPASDAASMPEKTAEPAEEAAADTSAAEPEAMAAAEADSAGGGIDGEAIYNTVCVACHSGAIPGIPKQGDKEQWAPYIAKGIDVLYDHAINGVMGKAMMMPPRGGGDLSDDEVKAAVDYMVSSSQ